MIAIRVNHSYTKKNIQNTLTKEITKALCKFIQEVGTIEEKANAQFGKFADLSSVLSVVNPVLARNGLVVIHTTEILEGRNVLVNNLMHISGEIVASKYLLPLIKETRGNPIHAEGGALTYFRRYCELGILGQNAGIPDNDGDFANPTPEKVTPINKNKAVGMPTILDDDTKKYYLRIVGDLIVKDKKLYNTLADALYIEFDFDRNTNLSDNITKPKHVTFIEEWLAANK